MSHMNESRHIRTSHVSIRLYFWTHHSGSESWHVTSHMKWVMSRVMSHMNESRHIPVRHVTHMNDVTSHMKESRHIWMSHVAYERVMSHMNESCHIWTSHVTIRVWLQTHLKRWTSSTLFLRPPYPILFLLPMTGGVRVYMCVCACVCTLAHTHTHSIVETSISDSLPSPDDRWCAFLHACVFVCVCTHPHSHRLNSWDLYIWFSSFSRWQVVCMYIYVCVCVCVYSPTLTHTQKHSWLWHSILFCLFCNTQLYSETQ